jgi:hypothetical protein
MLEHHHHHHVTHVTHSSHNINAMLEHGGSIGWASEPTAC